MRTLTRSTILAPCLLIVLSGIAAPAVAQVFTLTNPAPIAVTDATTVGAADPYPATIMVSGMGGTITDINVELVGITHTFPSDMDILLVAPNGTAQMILSDAGGSDDVVNIDVVLDDEAAAPIPVAGPMVTGTFQVSVYNVGDTFPAPAPAPGAGVNLTSFDGSDPNGSWSVYVVDDAGGDVGRILGVMLQVTTTGTLTTPFGTSGAIRVHDPRGFGSSNITVAGIPDRIDSVQVTLFDVNHPNPDDLDIYLISPGGITFGLMSDAGGTTDLVDVDIVLDDNAPTLLPDNTVLTSGTYRPTNYGTADNPRLPPLPPYNEPATANPTPASFNSLFGGSNPNGTWTLYLSDDVIGNVGTVVGGWRIQFATLPPRFVAYGVTAANELVSFNTQVPGFLTSTQPITGLVGGDTIIGLDFRPANGQLYGLGSGSRIYTVNRVTGAATQVGADGAFTLNGQSFGFDFNPVPDRIRVNSDLEQNVRLNPSNGALSGTDTALVYAAGDPNVGLDPAIGGAAYTNNFAGATSTTLFGIDTAQNVLVRQGGVNVPPGAPSPNSGELFTVGPLMINPIDDLTRVNSAFDIVTADGADVAYAALTINSTSSTLYGIDLVTGAAMAVGSIGPSATLLRALTLQPDTTFRNGFE